MVDGPSGGAAKGAMMPPVVLLLFHVAVLLATGALAVVIRRAALARWATYGISLLACGFALAVALIQLVADPIDASTITLPLGLPWIGANFRIDALSAFFLVVINLGGAAASLFGLGYGRHESEPRRVLPFFPAFLAGMNMVLLADDAFTFLLSW